MQSGVTLDEGGAGARAPWILMLFPATAGSFDFGSKCEEPNMAQVLGLLDPLNSIIEPEISDGSDALSNSSAPDDEEVRRGKKAFMVDNSWRSYWYYETHVCATAALGHTMKPYNVFSDCRAAHRIIVSHITTSCVYLLPPGV